MNKAVLTVAAVILLHLAGCEIRESSQNEPKDISFSATQGVQSDVISGKIEIINDDDAYNQLMLSLPSMSGEMPIYDAAGETLIAITGPADACVYFPVITGVEESDSKILVRITKKQFVDYAYGQGCESVNPMYTYNLATIKKTEKPVEVTYEGPYSASCESPVDVTGFDYQVLNSILRGVALVGGQDVDVFVQEYVNTYGSDFELQTVSDLAPVFSAFMSEEVIANLRCDQRVRSIDYPMVVSIAE